MAVTLIDLWLPILVSTVAVFFASFVMWMVLPHHKADWIGVPDEGSLIGALKGMSIKPGQYCFPYCASKEEMKDPAFMKRMQEGPSGMIVVRDGYDMGKNLMTSMSFNLAVSICVGYLAAATLGTGADGTAVFRLTSTVAFLSYAAALAWAPIWWGRSWSSTLKEMIDGLVYGLATGAIFMVMWPAAA